jgi:hypothetical protein
MFWKDPGFYCYRASLFLVLSRRMGGLVFPRMLGMGLVGDNFGSTLRGFLDFIIVLAPFALGGCSQVFPT